MPELILLFKSLALSGVLAGILADHATFNIPFPTLGGHLFWETYEAGDYRLQVNAVSGWWRILDAHGIRVARGTSEEQLRDLLCSRPTSVFSNYMDRGYSFSRIPASNQANGTVFLVHGWGVRARSMRELARGLSAAGYNTFSYDYPTSEKGIEAHAAVFLERLRECLKEIPENESIFFLTHSMGGLLLRGALAGMTEAECRRIRGIVMLGPPNRGSMLACLGGIPGVGVVNASLGDMAPWASSYTMTIPEPKWLPPTGIIAGRYDGKVAVKNTRLPEPLPFELIVADCTHPGLRKPANVLDSVLRFYRAGHF